MSNRVAMTPVTMFPVLALCQYNAIICNDRERAAGVRAQPHRVSDDAARCYATTIFAVLFDARA